MTFERVRLPLAAILLGVALFALWPRDGGAGQATAEQSARAAIVVEAGGEVVLEPTAAPTPAATPDPTPAATPAPTPAPTPLPPDTFSAVVLACRDNDGDRCRGEFERFPRRGDSFTALVRFEDARPGDTINVTLSGPGAQITGGPFALADGGDGYYYSRITYGDLGEGAYVLAALRNGEEVARTTLLQR
ncbi:MAG TPA: hypothetical protein VI277_09500 [Candidatus Limnocylindria bacterium]